MKVLPFKIPKTSSDTVVIQEDKGFAFYDKLHQHEEIQMSLILSGEGNLIVGDAITNYREGDVLVFGSHVPHVLNSDSSRAESFMISIFFTEKSFGKDFFELSEFNDLSIFFSNLSYGVKILSLQKELRE